MSNEKVVIKRDGQEEEFIPEKIVVSAYKAGLSIEDARKVAKNIEKRIEKKIESDKLRDMVVEEIAKIDPHAATNWAWYEALMKGRVTYEKGKYLVIPKGSLYLGKTVADVGKKGLSDLSEVKGILRELDEDLKHGIPRQKIHRRTYILYLAVLHSKVMNKETKLKAIEEINNFRKENGWKPFRLKRKLV